MEFEKINCRYCGRKIDLNDEACWRCGAPNIPEPPSWIQRIKSSLVSKQRSVWADRLAGLMPLHLLAAIFQLCLVIFFPVAGSINFLAGLISAVSIIFYYVFYTDWYKADEELRKQYGVYYLILLIIFVIVTKNFLF